MTALDKACAGVFGKLPARGDFVRENLPRGFTDPWDAWWQRGIAATQDRIGEAWVESWLEAPVWRFGLPPGLCGRDGVLGVWLPSVDKAGRYFPLTIAATAPFDWSGLVGRMEPFLAEAEQAGRDALEHDLAPAEVSRRAAAALAAAVASTAVADPGTELPARCAGWWTQGGTRVAPRAATGDRLPEGVAFAAMIDDGWAIAP